MTQAMMSTLSRTRHCVFRAIFETSTFVIGGSLSGSVKLLLLFWSIFRINEITDDCGVPRVPQPKQTAMSLLSVSAALKAVALCCSLALIHTAFTKCPCRNKRIHVKVCTEALCPGCKEFVLTQVIPTYTTLGKDVMDLQIIPFGNAIYHPDNQTATCQHGVGECDANTWEQCLIAVYPKPSDYLKMLECLENTLPMGSHDDKFAPSIFETCAQEASLEFPKIQYCHHDHDIANKLLQRAAKETPKEHTYVPWAIVDGTHMDEEHDDLLQVVCKAYTKKGGTHAACQQNYGNSGLLRGMPTSIFS